MLLKPRFGSRMWSGIWPPSKPAIDTPERAPAPFWPRPAVLPRPEPMPRPTRTRLCRAPLLSRRSLSFMSLHSLSLLSRCGWSGDGAPRRHASEGWHPCCLGVSTAAWTPAFAGVTEKLLRHLDHVMHLADHAADLRGVRQLDRAVHLAEAEAGQRLALVGRAADRRSGLGDLDGRHFAYSTTAAASASALCEPP